MKALKQESAQYKNEIFAQIEACYSESEVPSNEALMMLYAKIGEAICAQGEKAFVVFMAQEIKAMFPQVKGFSPRNLRRMRDFYLAYKNEPRALKMAQTLNWTQNTVILEYCESAVQRCYYLAIAMERNLSKLALIQAIATQEFENQPAIETTAQPDAPVSEVVAAKANVTPSTKESKCGTMLSLCQKAQGRYTSYNFKIKINLALQKYFNRMQGLCCYVVQARARGSAGNVISSGAGKNLNGKRLDTTCWHMLHCRCKKDVQFEEFENNSPEILTRLLQHVTIRL